MGRSPAPTGGRDPRRGMLVAGLAVAVVLLVGSVTAVVAWAPRVAEGSGVSDGRVPGPGPDDRQRMNERFHDRMHDRMFERMFDRSDAPGRSDDDAPPWWFDEPEAPSPAPSD